MAIMSLTSDSGSIIARSTAGNSFSVELAGGVTALGMLYIDDTTSTSAEISIEYGRFYTFAQPLTSLSIVSVCDAPYESAILFTAGEDFSLSMPEEVKIAGMALSFVVGSTYLIAFRDGIAVFAEVK